jgi:hypothetical protein
LKAADSAGSQHVTASVRSVVWEVAMVLRVSGSVAATSIVIVAGLAACSTVPKAPPANALSCSGSALAVHDSDPADSNLLTHGVAPVSAAPRQVGRMVGEPLVGTGYFATAAWQVSKVETANAGPVWTVSMPALENVTPDDESVFGADVTPYDGYVTATADTDTGQAEIAALDAAGHLGPVCQWTPFSMGTPTLDADHDALGGDELDLLPGAGVVVMLNSVPDGSSPEWLEGYSVDGGKRLWSVPVDPSGDFAVAGDVAFAWQEGATSTIDAIDVRDGRALWTRDAGSDDEDRLEWDGDGGIAAFGGRVYTLTRSIERGGPYHLRALDSDSGAVLWSVDIPASRPVVSITAVGPDDVLVGASGQPDNVPNAVSLRDARTGATLATVQTDADVTDAQVSRVAGVLATVVAANGTILVLSPDRDLDRQIAIPRGHVGSAPGDVDVALADGIAYVRRGAANQSVYGYSLATGARLWAAAAPGTPAADTIEPFDGGFWLVPDRHYVTAGQPVVSRLYKSPPAVSDQHHGR